MDIYTRLKQDHDEHRELARRIMETHGDSDERHDLWETLKRDCIAHANAEEQTFYAALIEKPETQEKARHSVSEHKDADDLIEELDELDMGSGGWIRKFEKLKDELEHHMDEEENEVFKQAKKVLDAGKSDELAGKFNKRKRSELSEVA